MPNVAKAASDNLREAVSGTRLSTPLVHSKCPECGGAVDTKPSTAFGRYVRLPWFTRLQLRLKWLAGIDYHFCAACEAFYSTMYYKGGQTRSKYQGRMTEMDWTGMLADGGK